jgi:asparagine synthase (glutamine-hydrolysing)
VDALTLERMGGTLRHRGPDDQDQYLDQHAGLVHTRLSIIDLSNGRQPLSNEDGTVWIVFNGEIYNFQELRGRLEAKGHRFKTATDTEAIVHLYEELGIDCLAELRGMFALAIWDSKRKRLLLARDRLGKKPLVYSLRDGRLAFASEIKAILELPGISRDIDPLAVDQYFSVGYIPQPRTIYRGVRKLPPAHYAIYEDGRLQIGRYWSPSVELDRARSEAQYGELVRSELAEATRLRLVSDVPLGAFLSGGIDSTIIVGLMQQFASQPTKTFSIRFSEREYDESRYARQAAEHLGTDHHEFLVRDECLEVLPELVWYFDEPFADSSAIPTYYVAKLTRQHVTVALTGDGGDEIFGGYDRYRVLQSINRLDFLPGGLKRLLSSPLLATCLPPARPGNLWQRIQTLQQLLSLPIPKRLARMASVSFRAEVKDELYTAEFAREMAGSDPLGFVEEAYERFPSRDSLTRAMLMDQETYLPGDILTKVDIASMAHGLECRSPFLDQRVVEIAARMPVEMKIRGSEGKHILKRIFKDLVPAETMSRKKMGFVVPLKRWFRKELKEYVSEVLLDPQSLERGYFRAEFIERLLIEHQQGMQDHTMRIWSLLCFELWHRRFVDANRQAFSVV